MSAAGRLDAVLKEQLLQMRWAAPVLLNMRISRNRVPV